LHIRGDFVQGSDFESEDIFKDQFCLPRISVENFDFIYLELPKIEICKRCSMLQGNPKGEKEKTWMYESIIVKEIYNL
jgi:hypothetical protein